jgi:hypothetical protein
VKRGGSLSFLVGTISNVLVMEIGRTDVGSLKMYDFITINTLPSYILSKNTESNAKLNPLNQKMQE